MCGPKGYDMSYDLAINRLPILAILIITRVRVLYSSLGLGVFFEGATFSGHKLLFVRQFDEDHLIVLGLGESVPVGAEMACEANLGSEGSGAVWTGDGGCCWRLGGSAFLSCLRCSWSATAILLASWDFTPLRTDARHFGLSIAACSHKLWLPMAKAFSDILRVSLKRFFWSPRERLPCWSSSNKSFLGSRWSAMRTTWPAQRSWVCIKMVWMLERLAWVKTSGNK